jgi:hypothetical protein
MPLGTFSLGNLQDQPSHFFTFLQLKGTIWMTDARMAMSLEIQFPTWASWVPGTLLLFPQTMAGWPSLIWQREAWEQSQEL